MKEGQCRIALGEIISYVFTELRTGGAVVQDIVNELKGGAEVRSEERRVGKECRL